MSIWKIHLLPLVVAVLVAACGGPTGPESPEAALQALQSASRDGAAERVLDLHDADTRAYFRQVVRTARARLEAGESPEAVLGDASGDPGLFLDGDLDIASARVALANARFAERVQRLQEVTLVSSRLRDTPPGEQPAAVVTVRIPGGAEQDVYFLHEPGGWVFDSYRHFQEQLDRP
jgi:hypothetical protein